jgi:predicted  nucleic acid-binding Zn-ribbon protein
MSEAADMHDIGIELTQARDRIAKLEAEIAELRKRLTFLEDLAGAVSAGKSFEEIRNDIRREVSRNA